MKAIETRYKGYRFRSRLEARWAVFFDALRIKWEYEQEGFELSGGERYLPDFFLPSFEKGIYVEVKATSGTFDRALKFAAEARKRLWLAEGTPALTCWRFVAESGSVEGMLQSKYLPGGKNGEELRFYTWPEFEVDTNEFAERSGTLVCDAVNAARSARFEFGERGA